MMDGALQREVAYRLIDELPLDRLGIVIQMLEMITGKHNSEGFRQGPDCVTSQNGDATNSDVSRFFGCLKDFPDGLEFQKEARNEWN